MPTEPSHKVVEFRTETAASMSAVPYGRVMLVVCASEAELVDI